MKNKGTVLILLSAFGYGLMPVFTRIALNNNSNIYEILFIRFSIAILLFLIYLTIKGSLKMLILPRKTLLKLIVLGGILFGFTSITLYSAVARLTPSIAEILYFTYPGVVILLSVVMRKEKLNKRKILSLVLLLLGVVSIINIDNVKISAIGVILALSCSLIYSSYIIYVKTPDIQEVDSLITAFYVMFFANFTYMIFGISTHSFNFKVTFIGLCAIFGITIFSTLLALIAFVFGSKYLESSEIAIVAAFEPIVTIFADMLILKHTVGFKMLLGTILILLSIIILSAKGSMSLNRYIKKFMDFD